MIKRVFWPFLTILSCSTPLVAQELSQAVRDWWINCDYRGDCSAETTATTDTNEALVLRVSRTLERESPILVSITPETPVLQGMRVTLEVSDHGQRGFPATSDEGQENTLGFELDTEDPFIEDLRRGKNLHIRFGFEGLGTDESFEASLSGLTDVLLVMDVVQLRIGRTDAAVAWGGAAPSSISDVELPRVVLPGNGTSDSDDQDPSNTTVTKVVYRTRDLPNEVVQYGHQVFNCNLDEAIEAFGRDPLGEQVMGPELAASYQQLKTAEWWDYHNEISTWELDAYLTKF